MYTLTISFTEATPTPASGYRVTYWPTGSPGSAVVVSPNPTSSPVVISGLTAASYDGTIESACGGGVYSGSQAFSAATSGCMCYTVNVLSGGVATFTYTNCFGDSVTEAVADGVVLSTQPGSPAPSLVIGDGFVSPPAACIS